MNKTADLGPASPWKCHFLWEPEGSVLSDEQARATDWLRLLVRKNSSAAICSIAHCCCIKVTDLWFRFSAVSYPEQERQSWIYEIVYSLPLVHWLLVSLLKLTSFHRFFILFIVHFWNMSISSDLILFPPTSGCCYCFSTAFGSSLSLSFETSEPFSSVSLWNGFSMSCACVCVFSLWLSSGNSWISFWCHPWPDYQWGRRMLISCDSQ